MSDVPSKMMQTSALVALTEEGVRRAAQVMLNEQAHKVMSAMAGDVIARRSTYYARVSDSNVNVSVTFYVGPKMYRHMGNYDPTYLVNHSLADLALNMKASLGTKVHRLMAQSGRFESTAA